MTPGALPRFWLTIQIALLRRGWINGCACLLCVFGAVAWLSAMPRLQAHVDAQQQTLARMRQALQKTGVPTPTAPRPLAEERLLNFYDNLGERRYAEQQIKALFAIADKAQLTLSQAEYKPGFDQNGQFHTYQIILPVKGGYGAIRQFCKQTLLAIPFASLDEMSFKRDAILSQTLEAKLHFTLYLAADDSPIAPSQTTVAGKAGTR